MDLTHVSCQRMDLHLDQHRTGNDPCLFEKSRTCPDFSVDPRENITMFCAAPTVLISIANAPEEVRANAQRSPSLHSRAPPAAATIEQVEKELGWELTHVYGLTETAPLITVCEPCRSITDFPFLNVPGSKPAREWNLSSSGELKVVLEDGSEVSRDGQTLGEIVVRGNVVMKGITTILRQPGKQSGMGGSTPGTRPWFTRMVMWKSGTVQGCHYQRRRKHFFRGT